MNKSTLKKIGIVTLSLGLGAYVLFLCSPLVINQIIKGYTGLIKQEINKASGLNSELEGVKFVTTPKLTAGLKVAKFGLYTPDNEKILNAENFQVKMSLLPILLRRIELDAVQLGNADINLKFDKSGNLDLLKYFPEVPAQNEEQAQTVSSDLPLGIRLSNNLPDIKVSKYSLTLTDGAKDYVFSGDKTEITKFIYNKSVQVVSSGKGILEGCEQFNYDLKVLNKIMPQGNLHDLVFNQEPVDEQEKPASEQVDMISVLKMIHDTKMTANADVKLALLPEGMKGYINIDNISLLELPESFAKLKFNKDKIDILSEIYTAKGEVSNLNGFVKTGKKPNIDLSFKSKAQISNVMKIVKELALIAGIQDLQTLTANGNFDADFNIKSDMKNVKSAGYLKIPSANLYYGLYNIGIDNINTDIVLDNNNVNIKNIGFSILNQPLKFYGTISQSADCDLHLAADRLSLKGLMIALGQAALMKDNNINSGLITLNADIAGKLDKINPVLKLYINDINIKNIPSNTTLKMPKTSVDIKAEGSGFNGVISSENIGVINPAATVSIPKVNASLNDKEIVISGTPVKIEKINLNVAGKIQNYLTEKILLDFVTSGDIRSKLSGDMNVVKQTLNLNYATTSPSSIVIPMFDKSKMDFTGNISILGSMTNPILKGVIDIPNLTIPEVPVTMSSLVVNLNGPIAQGNGSVKKFTSGGIEAENLTSDFLLKGENFYLKNLKGDAFDGKINGNIIYNINNAKTSIDFSGNSINATKAVYGAVGINNALSGTLSFNTKLTMVVADYNDMMKSLGGNLDFSIKNGDFLSIGRFENFLKADNIVTNGILKTTTSAILNSIGFADTAKYDYLEGDMSFSNGWAKLKTIKSAGPKLAYYITGKYNLVNGTTSVNILGRLDSSIVSKLGPIGELSAQKLFSYIPKFGTMTGNIVNALTTNPKNENVAMIPALTGSSSGYKDFKVVFNGGLESTSSIKSFKWLQVVDTSSLAPQTPSAQTLKESVKTIKKAVNEDLDNTVKSVTDTITTQKEQWNLTKDQFKNSAKEIKNLFK